MQPKRMLREGAPKSSVEMPTGMFRNEFLTRAGKQLEFQTGGA